MKLFHRARRSAGLAMAGLPLFDPCINFSQIPCHPGATDCKAARKFSALFHIVNRSHTERHLFQ